MARTFGYKAMAAYSLAAVFATSTSPVNAAIGDMPLVFKADLSGRNIMGIRECAVQTVVAFGKAANGQFSSVTDNDHDGHPVEFIIAMERENGIDEGPMIALRKDGAGPGSIRLYYTVEKSSAEMEAGPDDIQVVISLDKEDIARSGTAQIKTGRTASHELQASVRRIADGMVKTLRSCVKLPLIRP